MIYDVNSAPRSGIQISGAKALGETEYYILFLEFTILFAFNLIKLEIMTGWGATRPMFGIWNVYYRLKRV